MNTYEFKIAAEAVDESLDRLAEVQGVIAAIVREDVEGQSVCRIVATPGGQTKMNLLAWYLGTFSESDYEYFDDNYLVAAVS